MKEYKASLETQIKIKNDLEPESNMTAVERAMNARNRVDGSNYSNQFGTTAGINQMDAAAEQNQRWMESGSGNLRSPNHKSAMRVSETPKEPMTL